MTIEENKQAAGRFLEEWTGAFSRVIETRCGGPASLSWGPMPRASQPAVSPDSYLWWKQVFANDSGASAWIGAPEAAWSAIGSGAPGTAADGGRSAYLEMVARSLEETAAALGMDAANASARAGSEAAGAPSMDSLQAAEVLVTLKGTRLPPLLAAIDPQLAGAIGAPADSVAALAHAVSGAASRSEQPAAPPAEAGRDLLPVLDRLIDLELPMSVALGRATLPVRDVLKLTSGSLVELDRRVGESVEVLVNGSVVARGEVVSVKGNYGVRIQEIISRQDRMALRQKSGSESRRVAAG